MALGVGLVLVPILGSVFRSIPRVFSLRVATGATLLLLVWSTTGINAVATSAIVAVVLAVELKWEHAHHWRTAEASSAEKSAG
jgi:hypothetical protein